MDSSRVDDIIDDVDVASWDTIIPDNHQSGRSKKMQKSAYTYVHDVSLIFLVTSSPYHLANKGMESLLGKIECMVCSMFVSIVPGRGDKDKNTNQSQVGIVTSLFVLVEHRSTAGGRILDPVWNLEVRGVIEDSLDTSESVQDFGDRNGNGTCEGVLVGNPLSGQTGLHLLGSEEGVAGIGTVLIT